MSSGSILTLVIIALIVAGIVYVVNYVMDLPRMVRIAINVVIAIALVLWLFTQTGVLA